MKEIKFYPTSKDASLVVPEPKPSKQYLQEWYKNKKIFHGNKPIYEDGRIKNTSIKACMPFYDAMSAGYIQETWCDIHIQVNVNGSIDYNFSGFPQIMMHRENSSINMGDNFHKIEFIWHTAWLPKLPKGYSLLFTSPNNFLLPFKTLSGIIDSDVFYHTYEGNIPFYLDINFSGIIPAGTPMYQMIPIKRDSWKRSIEKWDEDLMKQRTGIRMKKFLGLYNNYFHIKKNYS